MFPGFPLKAESIITSPVICSNIAGSSLDELIYTTGNNKLVVTDVNNNYIGDFPVRIDGINKNAPYIKDMDNNGKPEIYIFTEKGVLHKYDTTGNKNKPYPITTDFKGSPFPIEYNEKFDEFLATEVGYPVLVPLTMGLFVSPYGATSLQEYFANGFEKYILDDPARVQTISPVLYGKIEEIIDEQA